MPSSTMSSSLPRPKTSPQHSHPSTLKSPSSLQSKFHLASKPNHTSSSPPPTKSNHLSPSKSIIRLSLFRNFFDTNHNHSNPSPKPVPLPSRPPIGQAKSQPTSIPRSVQTQPAQKRFSKRSSDPKPRPLPSPPKKSAPNTRPVLPAKPVAPLQLKPSSFTPTPNRRLSVSINTLKAPSPPRFTPPTIPKLGASTLTLVSMHSGPDVDASELAAIRLPSSPPSATTPLSPATTLSDPLTPSSLALLSEFPLPPRSLPFNPHAPPSIPLPPLPSSSPRSSPDVQSTENLLEMYFEQHTNPTAAQSELAWLEQESAEPLAVELSDADDEDAASEIDLEEPLDQMAVRLGYQAGVDERSETGSSAAGDEAEELAEQDEIAEEREYGRFGALDGASPRLLRGVASHAGLVRPTTAVLERKSYNSLRSTLVRGSPRSLRLVIAETSSSDEEEFDLTLDHHTRRPQLDRSPLTQTQAPAWAAAGVRRGSSGSMGSLVTTPSSSSCQTCQTGLATPTSASTRRELGPLFGDEVCHYPPGKPGSVERREWLTRGRLGRRASEAPLPFVLAPPPSRACSAERAKPITPPGRSSAGIRLRRLMLVDHQERRASQPVGSSCGASSLAHAFAAQRSVTSGIGYTHSSGNGSSFGYNHHGWSRVRYNQ